MLQGKRDTERDVGHLPLALCQAPCMCPQLQHLCEAGQPMPAADISP